MTKIKRRGPKACSVNELTARAHMVSCMRNYYSIRPFMACVPSMLKGSVVARSPTYCAVCVRVAGHCFASESRPHLLPPIRYIYRKELSQETLSRKVYANWSCFFGFCPRIFWGRELSVFQEKTIDHIQKQHRLVITELEIGAVGTDFSRRTSWRAREDPGRARTWKSMTKT
jgi:hypothetical protein